MILAHQDEISRLKDELLIMRREHRALETFRLGAERTLLHKEDVMSQYIRMKERLQTVRMFPLRARAIHCHCHTVWVRVSVFKILNDRLLWNEMLIRRKQSTYE